MQTKSGRKYFSSSFVFDWISYVNKINSDNSAELIVPDNTNIIAYKKGKVVKTGNVIKIQDNNVYSIEYNRVSYCKVNIMIM